MREPRARGDHREAAEAGGRFLEGRLAGEIAQERQAQLVEAARLGAERLAPGRHATVCDDLGQTLNGVDHVRVKIARRFACARAQAIDARAAEHGDERRVQQERYEHEHQGAAELAERDQYGGRHQHCDERGCHRVGEEVFDQLHVVGGRAHQITRPAPREIGRRQRVELLKHCQTHVGEQPVRDVVGEPGLAPVQDAGERRHHEQAREQRAGRLAALDGAHRERAEDADADQGRDARDAEKERQRQPGAIAARLVDERAQHRAPANLLGADDGLRLVTRVGVGPGDAIAIDGHHGRPGGNSHGAGAVPRLPGHQARISPAAADQRGVGALLHQTPLVEHENPIGADHAREPVREDERRTAPHETVECCLDQRLALGIHRRERLVEHQDGRVAQERARDRDALPLPAREPDAALADHRVVALRQTQDELLGVRGARGRAELVGARVGLAHPDVVLDGAVEEPRVLADERHAASHLLEAQLAQVAAADRDPAAIGIVEPEQQPRDRRLARAARAHDRDALARPNVEAQLDVRRATRPRIGERDVLEGHPGVGRFRAGRVIRHGRDGVEERENAASRGETQHPLVKQDAQLSQRTEHFDAEHQDDQQRRHGHLAGADAPGAERQRHRRPERDARVGDATRERVAAEDPHRAPEELVGAMLQLPGPRAALAERLECRQPLHRVEKIGAEGGVGAIAGQTRLAILAVPERRRQQHHERGDQQHERDRQIHERDESEDEQRRDRRDEELREILAEVGLELLHAFHHRKHHVAGPRADEVGGAERGDLGVENLAQPLLHPGGRVVRHHRARVVQGAPRGECQRRERDRGNQRGE